MRASFLLPDFAMQRSSRVLTPHVGAANAFNVDRPASDAGGGRPLSEDVALPDQMSGNT